MSKNDGGPAFPEVHEEYEAATKEMVAVHSKGMTLRDYFAAKALQGMYACAGYDGAPEDRAKWAYQAADAMLAERAK